MENKDVLGIVPDQYTGKEIIAGHSEEFQSEEEARTIYQQAKKKLLDVNNWENIASIPGTNFQVMDSDGEEVHRAVQEYDYLRINIPGPGSKEGDGYDWVHVEEIRERNEENLQIIAFRVRPTSNPESPRKETAHFYSKESTSTFMVMREGKKVTASIFDTNIISNKDASSLTDQIRDKLVAIGGIAGFSMIQWNSLAKGLLS